MNGFVDRGRYMGVLDAELARPERIDFVGSIKWREQAVFDSRDLGHLVAQRPRSRRFDPDRRSIPFVNHEAFIYSEELLKNPKDPNVGESLSLEEEYAPVREQGFRRAVVKAYDHRCALRGIRVRTLDGHTLVEAAQIVPWSETRDDRPVNGLALCRTCHWTFDERLLSVSREYMVVTSKQLNVSGNLSGYLTSFEGRTIFVPSYESYQPDRDSLEWHRKHLLL